MTNTLDQTEQDALLARLDTQVIDDSPVVWICHDVNPRPVTAKMEQVMQPQGGYIDLADVGLT